MCHRFHRESLPLRRIVLITLIAAVTGLSAAASAQDLAKATAVPDLVRQLEEATIAIAAQLRPTVVSVTSYVRRPEGAQSPRAQAGPSWEQADSEEYPGLVRLASASGIVISGDGDVRTCRHVLVRPDGRMADFVDIETQSNHRYIARVLGSEPTIDIAMLRIEILDGQVPPDIKPASIGSLERLHPGSFVFAMGDPFGPTTAFASGVVSGFPNRDCYQADIVSTFLQASMTVHPESHGGLLATLDGKVIGILTPMVTSQDDRITQASTGLTFALPIGTALAVGQALKFRQSHESPWMGVAVLSLSGLRDEMNDVAAYHALPKPLSGVYIEDLYTPSPAAASDVRVGDFLVEVDGAGIEDVADFQRSLYLAGIGRSVNIRIFRGGELLEKKLVIERRPEAANRP